MQASVITKEIGLENKALQFLSQLWLNNSLNLHCFAKILLYIHKIRKLQQLSNSKIQPKNHVSITRINEEESARIDQTEETFIFRASVAEEWRCLEEEMIQGTIPRPRAQKRSKMTWTGNIKSWTRLSFDQLDQETK